MASRRVVPIVVTLVVVVCWLALPAIGAEWSRFRGPNGSGVAEATGLPSELGPNDNKIWEAEVPFGRSSPAVARDRVFLTAVEEGKLLTLALDRATGETLWRRSLERAKPAEFHRATDSSTPSPVTDGSNVYAFFHESGLVSYSRSGKERWRVPMGPFRNFYGIAASPVLAGKAVLMLCDQAEGSFLLAVNRKSGKRLWRAERSARVESYSTPVLYPDADDPEAVLVVGSRWVDAYDLETGESLWKLSGVGPGVVASPVLAGDTLFLLAENHAEPGFPEFAPILAEHDANGDGSLDREEVAEHWVLGHFGWLDADASGAISTADWKYSWDDLSSEHWGVYAIRIPRDGSEPKILWNYRKNVPNIPSPLHYDGVFYMVRDGIVTSLDPGTGELIKRGRLGDGSPKVYASPVAADGKIYIGTLEGGLSVLEAGGEWSVLSTTDFEDEIWASPAIADSRIYLRTKGKLYCFGVEE